MAVALRRLFDGGPVGSILGLLAGVVVLPRVRSALIVLREQLALRTSVDSVDEDVPQTGRRGQPLGEVQVDQSCVCGGQRTTVGDPAVPHPTPPQPRGR